MDDFKTISKYKNLPISAYFSKNRRTFQRETDRQTDRPRDRQTDIESNVMIVIE